MRLDYQFLALRGRAALSTRSMGLRYHRRHLLGAAPVIIAVGMITAFGALHQGSAQASAVATTQLPAPSTTPQNSSPTPETPTTVTPTSVHASGPYSFLEPDGMGGTAVRLDPCGGPLVLNYDPRGEGYAAFSDLVRVGQELGAALDHDVVSHVVGDGPVPSGVIVDIGWVPKFADIAPNDPDVVGLGGPEYIGDTIVSGKVQLVTTPTNGLPAPGMGPGAFGAVLAHELGHVVGLDHVNDPTEIMNPSLQPNKDAQYAPGDLTGLHLLGGPCQ